MEIHLTSAPVKPGETLFDTSLADGFTSITPALAPATVSWRARTLAWLRHPRLRSLPALLFGSLVILNAIDLLTTRLVLSRGGEEGNPLMSPVIDNMFEAIAVKTLCLVVIGMLMLRSRRANSMLIVIGAVNLWYLIVVGWNIKVLASLI